MPIDQTHPRHDNVSVSELEFRTSTQHPFYKARLEDLLRGNPSLFAQILAAAAKREGRYKNGFQDKEGQMVLITESLGRVAIDNNETVPPDAIDAHLN